MDELANTMLDEKGKTKKKTELLNLYKIFKPAK